MNNEWLAALSGGLLIGLAVSLMLVLNGRVTGISGIIYGLLNPVKGEILWRIYFIGGLIGGGLIFQFFNTSLTLPAEIIKLDWKIPVAGLLVGFGTVLGSGCTSGHGICGISRLSIRSLVATGLFMLFGIFTVFIVRMLGAPL